MLSVFLFLIAASALIAMACCGDDDGKLSIFLTIAGGAALMYAVV